MAENELNEVVGDVPAIPAEAPVSEAPEAPEAPAQPADGAPAVETDVTPDPAKLQAEILRLQKRKAQSEAAYWQRKEEAERRAAAQPAVAETAPAQPAEPNQDDFDDYNDYVAAVADHRVKVARTEWNREIADKTANENNAKRQADLQTKLEAGYTKYDDFAEVAFDHTAIHITPMIVDILTDCDNPADVAYHLAKNRVEGVSISRMTPTQAARAIAKIDLSYAGEKPPPPKKTTNAPPPINPVGASNTVGGKDPEKMTQAEYNAYRLKQGAKPF